MNVKSVIFVGFLLVGVILLMGLKDETHPKWEYGMLWYSPMEDDLFVSNLPDDEKGSENVIGSNRFCWRSNAAYAVHLSLQSNKLLTRGISDEELEKRRVMNREGTENFLKAIGVTEDSIREFYGAISNQGGLRDVLRILGEKGWELVSAGQMNYHDSPYYAPEFFYFKRRIQ